MEELCKFTEEVFRFVGQRVSNPSDAADLAQQTYLIACAKFGSFRNGNLKAWLLAIARNLVVDHYRRRNRSKFVEIESAASTESEPALQTSGEDIPEVCDSRDRLRCFLCITDRLRLEEQVAVLLADVLAYRDRESAGAMTVSVPTFKLLLHQARGRLREVTQGTCSLGEKTTDVSTETGREAQDASGQNVPDGDSMPACDGCRGRECGQTCCSVGVGGEKAPALFVREPPGGAAAETSPASCGCGNCPLGASCEQRSCRDGVCRRGPKCCRLVPRLRELRARLFETLRAGLPAGMPSTVITFGWWIVDQLEICASAEAWEFLGMLM